MIELLQCRFKRIDGGAVAMKTRVWSRYLTGQAQARAYLFTYELRSCQICLFRIQYFAFKASPKKKGAEKKFAFHVWTQNSGILGCTGIFIIQMYNSIIRIIIFVHFIHTVIESASPQGSHGRVTGIH